MSNQRDNTIQTRNSSTFGENTFILFLAKKLDEKNDTTPMFVHN